MEMDEFMDEDGMKWSNGEWDITWGHLRGAELKEKDIDTGFEEVGHNKEAKEDRER